MSNYPLYDKTANIIKAPHECLRQGESFVWGRTSRLLDLIDKRSFTIWLQCMGKKNLKQIKQLINYRHHMISIIYKLSRQLPLLKIKKNRPTSRFFVDGDYTAWYTFFMSNYPLNNKSADVIKAELECLRQGEPFVWGRTSRLLDLIDKTGYWRNEDRSFTIWLQNKAPLLGVKISMAWRYMASGRFYVRLQQDFPFLADKPLTAVSDELSPENLELLSRISRCAPDDIFKPLVVKVLSGEAKRSDLRAAWLAFKPMLEGKTARGRGVAVHKVKAEVMSENDQRLVTALMKNQLANSDASWTKRGPLDINRVFFNVSLSSDQKFDAVVVTHGKRSVFFLHGVKICINSDSLSPRFISELKCLSEECDSLWLAFPSLSNVAPIERIPKTVGIITIDSNGVHTVRLPKLEEQVGATDSLAKTLLKLMLK